MDFDEFLDDKPKPKECVICTDKVLAPILTRYVERRREASTKVTVHALSNWIKQKHPERKRATSTIRNHIRECLGYEEA